MYIYIRVILNTPRLTLYQEVSRKQHGDLGNHNGNHGNATSTIEASAKEKEEWGDETSETGTPI